MNFNKNIQIEGMPPADTIRRHILFALNNSQTSQDIKKLAEKAALIEKIKTANDSIVFSSDDVQIIRQCCFAALPDGATIQILSEIAPHDLAV